MLMTYVNNMDPSGVPAGKTQPAMGVNLQRDILYGTDLFIDDDVLFEPLIVHYFSGAQPDYDDRMIEPVFAVADPNAESQVIAVWSTGQGIFPR